MEIKKHLPSTMQVLFGRGRYLVFFITIVLMEQRKW